MGRPITPSISPLVFALLNAVVLSADQLCFDSAAPPFELFEILVSKGAMMRDETRSFIEGTRRTAHAFGQRSGKGNDVL
ncbi:MAG: hypothetical protein VX670_09330 [Candidatus Latescibacterota bacterium]|nr:hypothetical protein [Candidatus Latescibacterota bacterium]